MRELNLEINKYYRKRNDAIAFVYEKIGQKFNYSNVSGENKGWEGLEVLLNGRQNNYDLSDYDFVEEVANENGDPLTKEKIKVGDYYERNDGKIVEVYAVFPARYSVGSSDFCLVYDVNELGEYLSNPESVASIKKKSPNPTIKIKHNGTYKTRDGRTIKVIQTIDNLFFGEYPQLGTFAINLNEVKENGKSVHGNSLQDLVKEA